MLGKIAGQAGPWLFAELAMEGIADQALIVDNPAQTIAKGGAAKK